MQEENLKIMHKIANFGEQKVKNKFFVDYGFNFWSCQKPSVIKKFCGPKNLGGFLG
jgi:hypothetical protein